MSSPDMSVYNVLLPILGGIIIFLNLLVVISSGIIIKKDVEPRTTYMFLGNIGLCDMMTGFAGLFGHFSPPILKIEMVCALGVGLLLSPTLASIYNVMLIAIDRYLYILYGMKYKIYMYPSRARYLIVSIWILAFITGFSPTLGWDMGGVKNNECWLVLMAPQGLVITINIIGLIPIVVVVVLYTVILYRALKKIGEIKRTCRGSKNSSSSDLRFFKGRSVGDATKGEVQKFNNEPTQWKATLIVVLTTGSFVVTWMPYFIVSATTGECPLYSPLAMLGFANSLLNPIIYAWWHNGFRTNFLKQLKRFCCTDNEKSVMISTKG